MTNSENPVTGFALGEALQKGDVTRREAQTIVDGIMEDELPTDNQGMLR